LGLDDDGLWVVVMAIVGYGGMLELGVQTAVIKLVAQKHAVDDREGLQRVVSTAYAFFQGAGLLVGGVLALVVPVVVDRLTSAPQNSETLRLLLVILGANTAVCFPTYVLGGVLFGLQRYVAKSVLDMLLVTINALLTFAALERGMGIVGLALVKTVVDVAGIASLAVMARIIMPELKIRLGKVSVSSFRELFGLGGKIFISSTTTRIAANTEPVLISAILSNAWTAVFSVPKRLVEYVKTISMTATTGFMPMFSELQGRGDMRRVAQIYEQYTRYILLLVIPFISAVMVLGVPFIRLWVGEELAARGGSLVYYLSVAFLFDSLQPLVWRLMIGIGRVDFLVAVSAAGSMAYLALGALLVHMYGIDGIGIAAVAVMLFNQVCYLPHVSRVLGISPLKHLFDCQLIPLILWCIFDIIFYILKLIIGVDGYFKLIFIFSIGFLLYMIVGYFMILNQNERNLCSRSWSMIRAKTIF
jgi:O-antigen/teichoic acid export membrane protein